MLFFRITIWTSERLQPFSGVRKYSTSKIEAVQQTLERRCRKYFGGSFRRIEVVMLSVLSQEVGAYQNREAGHNLRNTLPPRLLGIALDTRTNEYTIEEDGITYRMDLAAFLALKNHYKGGHQEPLSSWYRGLNQSAGQRVRSTGAPKKEDDVFPGETAKG